MSVEAQVKGTRLVLDLKPQTEGHHDNDNVHHTSSNDEDNGGSSSLQDEKQILLGDVAGANIQEGLSQTDPINFIYEFQFESALDVPSTSSILPFMDILNISRNSVYTQLLEKFKYELLSKIETCNQSMLTKLVNMSFAYIRYPELQEIPVTAMKRAETIPPEILQHLCDTDSLYCLCPIEVKRKIWLQKTPSSKRLFKKTIEKLCSAFVNDVELRGSSMDFMDTTSPESRMEHPSIKALLEVIGNENELYQAITVYIRRSYENQDKNSSKKSSSSSGNNNNNNNPSSSSGGDMKYNRLYCTLRADLLMALHNENFSLSEQDPCHRLTWSLNSCKSNEDIGEKQLQEIQSILQPLEGTSLSKDFKMILGDLFCVKIVLKAIHRKLNACTQAQQLPRNIYDIEYLCQLLMFGIDKKKFKSKNKLPSIPKPVASTLIPLLLAMKVQHQYESEYKTALQTLGGLGGGSSSSSSSGLGMFLDDEKRYNTLINEEWLDLAFQYQLFRMIMGYSIIRLLRDGGGEFELEFLNKFVMEIYVPYITRHVSQAKSDPVDTANTTSIEVFTVEEYKTILNILFKGGNSPNTIQNRILMVEHVLVPVAKLRTDLVLLLCQSFNTYFHVMGVDEVKIYYASIYKLKIFEQNLFNDVDTNALVLSLPNDDAIIEALKQLLQRIKQTGSKITINIQSTDIRSKDVDEALIQHQPEELEVSQAIEKHMSTVNSWKDTLLQRPKPLSDIDMDVSTENEDTPKRKGGKSKARVIVDEEQEMDKDPSSEDN